MDNNPWGNPNTPDPSAAQSGNLDASTQQQQEALPMLSAPMDGTTLMLLTLVWGFKQMQNNMQNQFMAQTQAMQGMYQSMQNFQNSFNQGQASALAPAPTIIQNSMPSGDPKS